MINGFVLYSILGYYLSHKELTVSHKKIVYTLGIIGFLTNFVGTAILTDPETGINELFRGAFNWPCLFQTIAFFVFFQKPGREAVQKERIASIIEIVRKYYYHPWRGGMLL